MWLALRSRSTPFSRMWPSRALLALLGFLWPASFALTTAPVQRWVTSLSGDVIQPAEQCRLFTVLVNGVFEPWFCLLLLLSVKLHWNGCAARALAVFTCGCRRYHARPFVGVSQSQFFRDLVNFWR